MPLDYNVVILEDCTSSRTPEVQRANIGDMACIGAAIMTCTEFESGGLAHIEDIAAHVRAAARAESNEECNKNR